jgi:hypothetical protein
MRTRVLFLTLAVAAALPSFASVPAWVKAAIPAQLPPAGDARSVVLLDETVVLVTDSANITTRHRRIVKILTPAGKEDAYVGVWFDNDTKLRALRGWSIHPNGEEYEVKEKEAMEMTASEYELFTDTRTKMLRLPADPGSVVAYESERRERPYMLQSAWHFQEDIPVGIARYQLVLPHGWSHDVRWLHHPAVEPVAPLTWEVRNVAPIADEPRRPAISSLAAKAGFNFLAPGAKPLSWSDLARWYGSLATPRSLSTPAMQTKVRELTAGGDALRALARFAQRDVRYVAVEIGIGGFQPHAAGDVFAKRFGDCKDKVTLLRTMLKEAGVDAYAVLVHTDRGSTDPDFPSMHAFDHVIAAIPIAAEAAKGMPAAIDHPKLGKLLLFDPTSSLTPFGELPEYLQASRGLLVTNDGGELIDLPSHAPDASLLRRTAKLTLDEKGTLSGVIEEVRSGSQAASMRAQLQQLTAAERVRLVESRVGAHMSSSTASEVTFEHVDDPEQNLVVRYKLTAPQYAKRVADMLLIRPRVVGEKAESQVTGKRTYAYVTDGPALHLDDIEIRMPATVKLDELPAKVETKTPHVQYTSASTFENGVLRYTRRYSQSAYMVDPDKVAEWNKASSAIAADERASAVFK